MFLNDPHRWLAKQTRDWVGQDIVTEQQAEKILSLYPAQSQRWGRILISAFGAVMIGLGVILLFAYNWEQMSRFSKMGVVLLGLLLAHVLAVLAWQRGNRSLGEGLFVLATMLFGAGIWLVAQIYHLDAHYPNAFLLWGMGALALAWALPSLPQAVLAVVLVTVWHLLEALDFEFAAHQALWLILLGVFPLIWRLRSPLLARLASTAFFISAALTSMLVDEHLVGSVLVLFSSAIIFLAHATARSTNPVFEQLADELARPAYLVFVLILFLLTFSDLTNDLLQVRFASLHEYLYFYGGLLLSQGLFVYLLVKRIINPVVLAVEVTALIELFPALLSAFVVIEAEALVFNVLLLMMGIGLIVEGNKRADGKKMFWGSLILAALVLARFADLFDSLVARAMAFLVVGGLLFVAGHYIFRQRQDRS